jgi:predicted small lipoprotein YifL
VSKATRLFVILPALAVMAAGLSACGRRGALELPPAEKPAPAAQGQILSDPAPAAPEKKKPDTPFILDPLLD